MPSKERVSLSAMQALKQCALDSSSVPRRELGEGMRRRAWQNHPKTQQWRPKT